jgi:hypothetical protein
MDLLVLTRSDQLLLTAKEYFFFLTKQANLRKSSTILILSVGENQYSRPPCTNQFRKATFNTEKILLYKTSKLNEEFNRTEPSPSKRVPGIS